MSKPKPNKHKTTDALLDERQTTHGDFTDNANFAQHVKNFMREQQGWEKMEDIHKEALDYIIMKISRIFAGDPSFDDAWDDIAGYAQLPKKFNHGHVKIDL